MQNCLKTEVSVTMKWLKGFVLGGEIEEGKGRLELINLKNYARKHVYIIIKDKRFKWFSNST